MRRYLHFLLLLATGLLILLLGDCTSRSSTGITDFLNLHDTVRYVGMETCRSCHANVHDTYIHTGMGASFGRATPGRSKASFGDHALVHDPASDFYYYPFFQDSVLYIREFRLEGGDTVHNRLEIVSYIVGSGHHTNSHIIDRNGYLYQAPITYYTQSKRWDLAPGYEDGANSRFSRILATECITCHNHLPGHVAGSENKYFEMPEGIACERCHGPGQLHVEAMLAGKTVDTARVADRTIVNPRRLPRDRQTDLCQRCHLQGVAVLKPGRSFFDFRPGMALHEVMNVFLPRYEDSDERFIMASQADRLRLSACYLQSKELTCITCHHPHVSVRDTGREKYNQACRSCHQKQGCSAPLAERQARGDDCAGCHMPRSGSIDIPHVSITDHYIRKDYRAGRLKDAERGKAGRFLGLQSMASTVASPVEMAEGYIALYDKFVFDEAMLDSAASWLVRARDKEERLFPVRVHLLFARRDYGALGLIADQRDTLGLDAWTAYRLGEGSMKSLRHRKGLLFLARAAAQAPFNLEFQEKYGVALGMNGKGEAAERIFRLVLLEDPARPLALTNLGYLRALQGDYAAAETYYRKALALDPDFAQARENLDALRQVLKKRADRR
jgi:hypothetical protein